MSKQMAEMYISVCAKCSCTLTRRTCVHETLMYRQMCSPLAIRGILPMYTRTCSHLGVHVYMKYQCTHGRVLISILLDRESIDFGGSG